MNTRRTIFLESILKQITSVEDLDNLFEDMLTPKEYHDIIERFYICRELNEGATVQQVCDTLGVASATVVRGNRVLKYGTGMLKRLVTKFSK